MGYFFSFFYLKKNLPHQSQIGLGLDWNKKCCKEAHTDVSNLQLLQELKAVKFTGWRNLLQITHMKKASPEYKANTLFFVMKKSEEKALSSYLFKMAAVSLQFWD